MPLVPTEEIYAALLDDEAFARLPDLLAQAASARSAILHWRHNDGQVNVLAYAHFTPSDIEVYLRDYIHFDPWLALVTSARAPKNVILAADNYMSENRLEDGVFYREFIRGQGDDSFHCLCAAFSSDHGQGTLGVHRGRRDLHFEAADIANLQIVAGHVGKVLKIRAGVEARARADSVGRSTLDTLALCTVTVRADGRAIHSNAAAERVLRRGDGLVLKCGAIGSPSQAGAAQLSRAIARATAAVGPSGATAIVHRMDGEWPYVVTATPLVGQFGSRVCVLLFKDPDAEESSLVGRVQSLFGLTKVEASIAVAIFRGCSLAEIARTRDVQLSTVKSQLKSLTAKLGCSRQAEVSAWISRVPPAIDDPNAA